MSTRLMLETGFSFNRERYNNVYEPGVGQPQCHAGVQPRLPGASALSLQEGVREN